MTLEVVQKRMDEFAVKEVEQEFRRMRVGPDFFESPKRGRSPVKKTTAGPFTVPLTPGPQVPVWLDPPQISPERSQSLEQSQVSSKRSQRDDKGRVRGGVRGGSRGGARGVRGGKKAVTKEVVVEEEEEEEEEEAEEEVVKYSRSGRPIRPKQR